MVSVKFLSVNLVALTTALGIGTAASAEVVTISQTFFNSSNATRSYSFYQYAPLAGGSAASVMSGSVSATLTDLNGNGATLGAVNGLAMYTATVNEIAPFDQFI